MTNFAKSNLEKYIDRSLEYLVELPSLWASSDYMDRQKLQHSIFPDGIYYNKKKEENRTTKINNVFALIAHHKGVLEENITGCSEILFKKSGLVASTGLEPVSKV